MRKIIINAMCGAAIGAVMGHIGYGMGTWQFWAILLSAIVVIISSAIND